jgi:hypothetical protein
VRKPSERPIASIVLKDQFLSQGLKISLALSPEHIVSCIMMRFDFRLRNIHLRASFFGAPPTPRALKERKIIFPSVEGISLL